MQAKEYQSLQMTMAPSRVAVTVAVVAAIFLMAWPAAAQDGDVAETPPVCACLEAVSDPAGVLQNPVAATSVYDDSNRMAITTQAGKAYFLNTETGPDSGC